ncbi:MAG: BatD family protein [Campylobacterota bacterium]|nr:BatD family protein [Campylobacterota bacterium]
MRNRGRSIGKIIFVLVSTFQLLWAAGVEATLANTEVVQGNMAQLRIVATGDRAAFPNITEIGGSQVLGRHQGQSNSFTYINGKSESKHTTVLTLTFAPQQDMTIPSYSVNIDGTVYKTEPIKLKVTKSSAPQVANSNKFSLLMRTEKKSAMVGEPFIVTVFFSLQNGVRLSENPQYNKPEFKGFFVKEVEQEKAYREGNRQVTELKYILIPQSEGNFTLEPATAKIGIADTSRRDMFGRFFGTVWTPIASNTINIDVKKKPEDTDLIGNFTIENTIDKQSIKANKPVNLTVKIEGEGSLEDLEFPNYEIDGVTVYSDDATIESNLVGDKLHSTLTKSFAFISDHDFSIPARSISVYDTKKAKVNNLEIPAYKIKVEASKIAVPVSNTLDKGVVQTDLKQVDTPQHSAAKKEVKIKSVAWWMLAVAFVLGILFMYLLRYLPTAKWKSNKSPFKESEALKILYAHMSEDAEAEVMVRKLYAKKNGDKSVIIDKKVLKALVEKYKDQ